MAANNSISLVNLDFDTLKSTLKTYLKGQSLFQDYDFDGSNMSVLLDILSYNSYLNTFYLNMVASEMFLDSAQLRNSVISIAKSLNYTPRSSKSSKALLNLTFAQSNLTSFEIPDYKPSKTVVISTIDVKVSRPNFKSFDIDEVKENLLFAQSYAKNELGLKIEYIYIVTPLILRPSIQKEYIYYKSIDVLPSNIMINSITISFTNTDI